MAALASAAASVVDSGVEFVIIRRSTTEAAESTVGPRSDPRAERLAVAHDPVGGRKHVGAGRRNRAASRGAWPPPPSVIKKRAASCGGTSTTFPNPKCRCGLTHSPRSSPPSPRSPTLPENSNGSATNGSSRGLLLLLLGIGLARAPAAAAGVLGSIAVPILASLPTTTS
ncbi:hypothetical protein ZWY2020_016467 [Hordeum vulgare]|nr:hypothetical protein ZWY2020_016467 [Hordeum vulgare]